MSKVAVTDWSTTAEDNTDVGGISLAENVMLPSAVNNALREVMAQVAAGIDNGDFSEVIATASTTEVLTGTNTVKAVTADALAALWEKGSNVASAATVSLGEGGFFHITGTTTITDIDFATAKDGRGVWVVFDAALTLTHNGTTLQLPGGASITTAAGDRALFVQDSGDNIICLDYIRASGQPVTTVGAARGGTGLTSPGSSGNVLTSDGTGWISAAAPTSGQPVPTSDTYAVNSLVLMYYNSTSLANGNTVSGGSLAQFAGTPSAPTAGNTQSGTWKNISGGSRGAGSQVGYFVRTA